MKFPGRTPETREFKRVYYENSKTLQKQSLILCFCSAFVLLYYALSVLLSIFSVNTDVDTMINFAGASLRFSQRWPISFG